MESKRTCPECHLIFEALLPETGVLACPLCSTVFSAVAPLVPTLTAIGPAPVTSGRQVLRGVLALGTLVFLGCGLLYAYHLVAGITHRSVAAAGPILPPEQPASDSFSLEPPPADLEVIPVIPQAPPRTTPPRLRLAPAPPEIRSIARSREVEPSSPLEQRVNRAMDNGLAYLRKNYADIPQERNYIGLLGLTLLECGVTADDLTIQQIARLIRAAERDLRQTYELTLAILFLDRLGEPRDHMLIRTFGHRLLAGQLECGTWSYSCLVNDAKRFQPQVPLILGWPGTLSPKNPNRMRVLYRGDNSNTQFALLGLWVAQRHGVSSRPALLATEQYFRNTQLVDGAWSYHANLRLYRDSMTCAGLMSLAMRHGVIGGQGRDIQPNQPLHVRDGAIDQGLRYLAGSLNKIHVAGGHITGVEARDPLYFLWSLERLAAIYDLKSFGTREWYPWAAEMLVKVQQADGRWTGIGDPIGTCFALLILKRSNFAKDLQLTVQGSPSHPAPDMSGPTIVQGMDAFMRPISKPKSPPSLPGTALPRGAAAPLGPSITQTPESK